MGLGKTITAGLILRQVWLSGKARRILLMVPKAVAIQWQNELYEKFNLNVPIYDGAKLEWKSTHGRQGPLRKDVSRSKWHQEPFVLCSSQLMRRRDRAEDLLAAEDWDLIVLDEAHHARRRGGIGLNENRPNALLRLMRRLELKCEALLFLTATPMQVHPVEVYDLLELLGLPTKWKEDWRRFELYFEKAGGNPSEDDMLFLAQMFRDTEEAFGEVGEDALAPAFPKLSRLGRKRILAALQDKSEIPLKRLGRDDRQATLRLLQRFSPLRYRMARQTRDVLREYYRRGMLSSRIPDRDVRDIGVDMTTAERQLYAAVEDYISTTYNNAEEDRPAVGFVMTIYRRRLASSFRALQQTLNDRLAGLRDGREAALGAEEDVDLDETRDDVMDVEEAQDLAKRALVAEEEASILAILKQIAHCGTESKVRRLVEELKTAFEGEYDSAIVFTQYTDTMDFLKEYLAEEFTSWPIATYSGEGGERLDAGKWIKHGKEKVKSDLKAGKIKLLVCTDAAGEGLNLQYCGVLANYDLPWNPMKVEQRIGRIDRIGQKYENIRILNFAYKETVEADVYFALGSRINLFRKIVGKLQPILSRLPKQFEAVALERPERREEAKRRLLADIDRGARESEDSAFDIDFGAEEALDLPELPKPAMTLEQIEEAMRQDEVPPPGMSWKPLDPGSFAAELPGMPESIRVATRAQVFDDHVDSHAFFSPGGEVFDQVQDSVGKEVELSDSREGLCWLVSPNGHDSKRLVILTNDGPRECSSLAELLESLESAGPPGELPSDHYRDRVVARVV